MTVFWSCAQHQVTTSLMKFAIGERNVATNLGINFNIVLKNIILELICHLQLHGQCSIPANTENVTYFASRSVVSAEWIVSRRSFSRSAIVCSKYSFWEL